MTRVHVLYYSSASGYFSHSPLIARNFPVSMILIVLVLYPTLNLIDNFLAWTDVWASISILATLAVGVVIGVLLASKIIAFFLNRFRTGTFYAIIGIIIGSLIAIYYNYEIYDYYLTVGVRWWEILIAGVALVIGGAFLIDCPLIVVPAKWNKEVKDF
jgi:putative membrane protein